MTLNYPKLFIYLFRHFLLFFQPVKTIRTGQCSRINTGAPLPPGADAVVMVEETELVESKQDVSYYSLSIFINLVLITFKMCGKL